MTLTIEQQLTAANNLEALWKGLMPGSLPDHGQFLRWAAMDPETAGFAINRSSRKVQRMIQAGTPMSAEDVAKYVTSVIRNELSSNREFNTVARAASGGRVITGRRVVTQ